MRAVQVAVTWASNLVAEESVWRWLSRGGQSPVERGRVLAGEQEGLILYISLHDKRRCVHRRNLNGPCRQHDFIPFSVI